MTLSHCDITLHAYIWLHRTLQTVSACYGATCNDCSISSRENFQLCTFIWSSKSQLWFWWKANHGHLTWWIVIHYWHHNGIKARNIHQSTNTLRKSLGPIVRKWPRYGNALLVIDPFVGESSSTFLNTFHQSESLSSIISSLRVFRYYLKHSYSICKRMMRITAE